MKHTFLKTAALMLAILVSIAGTAAVSAQEDTGAAPPVVRILSVEVPSRVTAGEQVTLTVTERESGIAIDEASVWALGNNYTDMNSLFPPSGYSCLLLGKSAGDGRVCHTFSQRGLFLLIATKEGYGPGLAHLGVKPDIPGKLTIRAPLRAEANETITIRVFQNRSNEEPASDAGVWAIELPGLFNLRLRFSEDAFPSEDNPEYIQGLGKSFLDAVTGNTTNLIDELNSRGLCLGQTDSNGELRHTFTDSGKYLLVAARDRYIPGTRLIKITSGEPPALKELLPQLQQLKQRLEHFRNPWKERTPQEHSLQQHPLRERPGRWFPDS